MNLNGISCNVVSGMLELDKFSGVLTQAVSGIASIRQVQTKDTPDEWGISSLNHAYCYGRHLHHNSQHGYIPFWVGLDITKNGAYVAITFERALLKGLSLETAVMGIPTGFSELPSHCTAGTCLIERRLVPGDFTRLCNTDDPQILTDFLNEVLSVL